MIGQLSFYQNCNILFHYFLHLLGLIWFVSSQLLHNLAMDMLTNHSTVQLGSHFFGDKVVNHNMLNFQSVEIDHKKCHRNVMVSQPFDYVVQLVYHIQEFYMFLNTFPSLAILYMYKNIRHLFNASQVGFIFTPKNNQLFSKGVTTYRFVYILTVFRHK